MEVKWVQHAGKDVLYVDYRGAKGEDDMLNILRRAVEVEATITEKKPELCNFEGTFGTEKIMGELNKSGKQRDEKISKIAVIGIVGVKKVLYKSYVAFTGAKNVKVFETEDQAFEWLTA